MFNNRSASSFLVFFSFASLLYFSILSLSHTHLKANAHHFNTKNIDTKARAHRHTHTSMHALFCALAVDGFLAARAVLCSSSSSIISTSSRRPASGEHPAAHFWSSWKMLRLTLPGALFCLARCSVLASAIPSLPYLVSKILL